jgi:hypothetical protein
MAHINPSAKIPATNTMIRGSGQLPSKPPNAAPRAVPIKRVLEAAQAAPRVDCVTIIVETAAQYDSGIGNDPATAKEPTAATAVRAECVTQPLFHIEENQLAVFGRIMHSPSRQAGYRGIAG